VVLNTVPNVSILNKVPSHNGPKHGPKQSRSLDIMIDTIILMINKMILQ